jgi:predicted acylesterase/phospholipase RssA
MTEQSTSAEPSQPFNRVGLALSGGGFRAALFHLGVVRFLRDLQLSNGRRALEFVDCICSVSGGSVLGAFMVLHWDNFIGTDEQFETSCEKFLVFIKSNVRARIFQLSIIRWSIPLLLFLRSFSRSNLLWGEYRRLFGNKELSDLQNDSKPKPELHILATDTEEGRLVSFSADGVRMSLNSAALGKSIEVAFAVAASSAFPPLFPPLSIENPVLGRSKYEKRVVSAMFTDGGVYDNLGIAKLKELQRSQENSRYIFVSDAGAPFKLQSNRLKWVIDRTVRTTDILMKRVGALEQDVPCVAAKLADSDPAPGSVFKENHYAQVARIRTDLDVFNEQEINALMICGFELAKQAWNAGVVSGKLIAGTNAPDVPDTWKTAVTRDGRISPKLEGSDRRRLFSWAWGWPGFTSLALPVAWLVAIIVGVHLLMPPSFVGGAHAAVENFFAYKSALDPDPAVRESFDLAIETGLDWDKGHVASELHYSWIVTPDFVYLFRSFTLSRCETSFPTPGATSTDKSQIEQLFFVSQGGRGYQLLTVNNIDCQNGERKVIDVVVFPEKIQKGNYLLMYLSKYGSVGNFSFDVAIANSLRAYPDPTLHSVHELPELFSRLWDAPKGKRFENVRFYGEGDLEPSSGLTSAAEDLIEKFSNVFRRNLDVLKPKLKADGIRKGFTFSLEDCLAQTARLKDDSWMYQSFGRAVGNKFNVIVRYYRPAEK